MKGGTVGLALSNISDKLKMQNFNLKPFGEKSTITKAKGNIIVEMDGNFASETLLDLSKQYSSKNSRHFVKIGEHGKFAVFPITGGDIIKGTLAIDTTMDLKPGMTLQFMKENDARVEENSTSCLIKMGVSSEPKSETPTENIAALCAFSDQGIIF